MARILSKEEAEELLEPLGGVEAVVEGSDAFEADFRYADAHREELKERYPDEWVGIRHKTVLAHGSTVDEVIEALEQAGEDIGSVVLHHACLEERRWVLASWSPGCRA